MKRPRPSPDAVKLATAICIEVFGRNHVTREHVEKIAAVIDANGKAST